MTERNYEIFNLSVLAIVGLVVIGILIYGLIISGVEWLMFITMVLIPLFGLEIDCIYCLVKTINDDEDYDL